VQRRRKKKAAPKNVFGTSSQSTQPAKKSRQIPNQSSKIRRHVAPPSVPGSRISETTKQSQRPPIEKSNIKDEKPVQSKTEVIEEDVIPVDIVDTSVKELEDKDPIIPEDNEIIENQILGKRSRKDLGLTKDEKVKQEKNQDAREKDQSGTSLKARQIIQDSMLKASKAVEEQKSVNKKKLETPKAESSETTKKPQRKFRNKTSSYQPANRAKRLDRSRHMEYKYEMRGLLTEINVAEEHRSNLLATIWARGERQTTIEAKEFLEEKLTEGILDKEQLITLEKIVDSYTIRR